MEIPHDFFLIIPGNSTLFLITPGKFTRYFFNTPGNSISSISLEEPILKNENPIFDEAEPDSDQANSFRLIYLDQDIYNICQPALT